LAVKKWRAFSIGGHIVGREINQKRKNPSQAEVVVPVPEENVLGIRAYDGKMAWSMADMHVPPIQA
jgi:hypothetical protein